MYCYKCQGLLKKKWKSMLSCSNCGREYELETFKLTDNTVSVSKK